MAWLVLLNTVLMVDLFAWPLDVLVFEKGTELITPLLICEATASASGNVSFSSQSDRLWYLSDRSL